MRLLWVIVLACACSGGGGKKTTVPPPTGDAGAASGGDAGSAGGGGGPLTTKECDAFADHAVVIAEMQRKATATEGDASATPEEIAAVQATMRAEARKLCPTMARAVWQCVMNAQDPQAYVDCAK